MNNRVMVSAFDQDSIVTSTDGVVIGGTVDSANRFNGWVGQTSGTANTNTWKFTRYFTKGGQYKVRFIYKKDSNCGKVNVGLDTSATALFNTVDTYNATPAYNNVLEITKEVTRGFHDITFAVNGKNASSSNYQIETNAIQFDLIQEYPEGLYQDDRPAQINQGSMVLLGKHTAAVAESTFTFNLANVDLVNVYSDIIIKIKGGSTASFALKLQLNGDSGTNYNLQADRIIAGAVAFINLTGQTSVQLASTSLITGANVGFTIDAWIKEELPTSIGRMDVTYLTNSNGAVMERGAGTHADTFLGKLSSLTILTSTSTWLAGTQFEIYGVKKQ